MLSVLFAISGSINKAQISYAKQNFIKKKPISCTLRDNRLLTVKLSVALFLVIHHVFQRK
ncbi:hypothetical protein B5P42_30915 [Bacillus sp. SRB_331]|nr:hypothetical protein B5P42_30915 [Bacillus sp. SRB_331]